MDKQNNIAYPNLKAEMARKGVKQKDLAELIGSSETCFEKRMCGRTPLPIEDAIKIRNTYFKHLPFEYLFSNTAIIPIHIEE